MSAMNPNKDFVSIQVDSVQIKHAMAIREARDARYSNLYTESSTDERWVGDLGEIVINDLLTMCSKSATQWHTDQVTEMPDFSFYDVTFDVKTVKRAVPIQSHYGAQISAKHLNTEMDYLVFCCYQTKTNELVVLGTIDKEKFKSIARYYGAGDKVHDHYTIREGHEIYSVLISDLTPFRDFVRDIIYRNRKKSQ